MIQTVLEVNLFEDRVRSAHEDVKIFKQKLKEKREMLTSAYANDSKFADLNEQIKTLQRLKNSVKEEISREPSVALLIQEVKDLKTEVKESQLCLFDHLQGYVIETKNTTIELDGEVQRIVPAYKLQKTQV